MCYVAVSVSQHYLGITLPHGRQSSVQRVDGYKRHLARAIDEQLLLAAATLPANTPATAGLNPLLVAVELQHREPSHSSLTTYQFLMTSPTKVSKG
jgi:hypothetical protein